MTVCGRSHPNTENCMCQKGCQEVDVEEVLTATVPSASASGDKELHFLSNPLLASPLPKEVGENGGLVI